MNGAHDRDGIFASLWIFVQSDAVWFPEGRFSTPTYFDGCVYVIVRCLGICSIAVSFLCAYLQILLFMGGLTSPGFCALALSEGKMFVKNVHVVLSETFLLLCMAVLPLKKQTSCRTKKSGLRSNERRNGRRKSGVVNK